MNESLFSARNALRVVALFLLFGMVIAIFKNSIIISQGNEKIQAKQLETLTQVLISQAALSASAPIVQGDQERLLELTNQLSQDHLVFDATIYDEAGVKLAQSDSGLRVREVLGLDTPLATASIGRQQLVEPVLNQEQIIGFVRITFETGKVTAISDHHYRKSDHRMYGMVLVSCLSGMLFIMILRRQQVRRKQQENLLLTSKD